MQRAFVPLGKIVVAVGFLGLVTATAAGQNSTPAGATSSTGMGSGASKFNTSYHGTPFAGTRPLPPALSGLSGFAPMVPSSPYLNAYGLPTRPPIWYYNPNAWGGYPARTGQSYTPSPSHLPSEAISRPPPSTSVDAPPAGAQVRMRFVTLKVTGFQDATDGDRLAKALEKMAGVKGATVKRKDDGSAVVKVWFSDRDPLEPAPLIEACAALGFSAAIADG